MCENLIGWRSLIVFYIDGEKHYKDDLIVLDDGRLNYLSVNTDIIFALT